jgi:DhnA family fructose-bisphosphate aldolase class Ia
MLPWARGNDLSTAQLREIQICAGPKLRRRTLHDMTKETCLNTFFRPDGNTMMIPMDHGTLVPVPGLGNGRDLIGQLRDYCDGFILNLGLALAAEAELEGKGVCLRTDCGNNFIPKSEPFKPAGAYRLWGVETAFQAGATAVMSMCFPGHGNEAAIISDCAALIEEAREADLPVMLESLPYGLGRGDAYTPENIRFAVRLAAELGADVVKTAYPGDKEAFRSIVAECYVPVIVLGGASGNDPQSILQMVRDAMDCGAKGIAIGRNVWQHAHPVKMAQALHAIVHENETAAKAGLLLA